MASFGYSFAPGAESVPVAGSRRAVNGPQSAVEVRSLTLPNRFVPGQIAPQALLQSAGGGGASSVDVLRRLMQLFAPQGVQPGVPSLDAYSPFRGAAGGNTYQDWMNRERALNRPPSAPPNGGVPAGTDVPLEHSPGAPPLLTYNNPPTGGGGPIGPSAPPPPPAGYQPSAGVINPLGRKFEGLDGFDVPGLFD